MWDKSGTLESRGEDSAQLLEALAHLAKPKGKHGGCLGCCPDLFDVEVERAHADLTEPARGRTANPAALVSRDARRHNPKSKLDRLRVCARTIAALRIMQTRKREEEGKEPDFRPQLHSASSLKHIAKGRADAARRIQKKWKARRRDAAGE